PGREIELEHRRARVHPGRAVHEDVDAPELAYRLVDGRFRIRLRRDIASDSDATVPSRARRRVGLGRVEVEAGHRSAGLRKGAHDGGANTAAPAGDDRGLAC